MFCSSSSRSNSEPFVCVKVPHNISQGHAHKNRHGITNGTTLAGKKMGGKKADDPAAVSGSTRTADATKPPSCSDISGQTSEQKSNLQN